MLEEDERAHTSRFSARKSRIACAALPSSSIFFESARARRIVQRVDLGARALLAGAICLDAEIRERHGFLRLRLRAHDSLERRIPRLVDRVRHGDHRRQRSFDHVVAELGLTLDGQLPVRVRDLRRLRHDREAEAVCDRRPQHRAVRVAGLLPEQDQVRALALERLRQRIARGNEVGSCRRFVADEDRPVRAHRQSLAQRVLGLRRPHRDEDDFALSGRILQPEGLLDRIGVEGVQRTLARAVEPLGSGSIRRSLGNLLDADGDLHSRHDSTEADLGRDACYRPTLRARTGAPVLL